MSQTSGQYLGFEEKCWKLTQKDKVRFAGIIDEFGKLIAGGFKDGLAPLEKDKKKLEEFIKFVSDISQRKTLDDSLGPINYLAARRDKVILLSFPFPLSGLTLLISADSSLYIESMAEYVVHVFDTEQARFIDGT